MIAQQPTDSTGKIINPNNRLGQGALAANYLFGVVYAFTYTPLQGVYPAENLTSTTRAKGLAASGIIVSLFGFINTYAGPIALERMKNRYIFVFVVWDLIETAIWWFCGVETVGRTIEEYVERLAPASRFECLCPLSSQVGRDLQRKVPSLRFPKEGHRCQDRRRPDRSSRRVDELLLYSM